MSAQRTPAPYLLRHVHSLSALPFHQRYLYYADYTATPFVVALLISVGSNPSCDIAELPNLPSLRNLPKL